NMSSYQTSVSGSNILKKFIRHDGQPITNPWIKDNSGINLNTGVAELLWQDQPNLVQNIQLESNKKFIVFHVSQSTIHEGNAVIALKESASGEIVWSWHIWVYGGDDLKAIKVKNNISKSGGRPGEEYFNFLSENLGSCYDGDLTAYPESKVWVKVSNGRQEKVIKIIREAGSTTASQYNNPYYQSGRKDPMLPSDGTNNNKVWYDKGGASNNNLPTDIWSSDGDAAGANAEIANTIKNPQTLNRSYEMDNRYYNLWDTKCNEDGGTTITTARFESATKSVYDPCPPGFCLPPNGAFTGFTRTGNNTGSSSEWNVSGSFDKGWHFRTVLKGESGGETIFFPASGYRLTNIGTLYIFGDVSYYWSSVPSDTSNYCSMYFYSGCINPLDSYGRSHGFAVRPVAEN
ncbi:MAG: fimbrillin family protein, partial [Candidatus Cryptobacteroides sp.]